MTDLIDFARAQLENQFLAGGMTLVIFTAILAMLRNVPASLWTLARRRLITTVDIADHDQAFFWVQKWLGEHEYTKRRARLLTASTRAAPLNDGMPKAITDEPVSQRRKLTEVVFSPAPGLHLIRFRGSFILIRRTRQQSDGTFGELTYRETLEFHTFSKDTVRDLIYEAREAAFPPDDNRIAVLRPAYSDWRISQRRLPRSLDSVVLSNGIAQTLHADLAWFFGARAWYEDHGIPYQRGYMLCGPPGNGKTSLVTAMASAFQRDVHILSLSTMTDGMLANLMQTLPEHALVLIEDIDRAFHERERTKDVSEHLTFSGFLNSIDGMAAASGRVLFMTTNHPERLDPAIHRPGRTDLRFDLGNATSMMADQLFLRFFPGEQQLAYDFGCELREACREFSMAELQEILIRDRGNPTRAVASLRREASPVREAAQ